MDVWEGETYTELTRKRRWCFSDSTQKAIESFEERLIQKKKKIEGETLWKKHKPFFQTGKMELEREWKTGNRMMEIYRVSADRFCSSKKKKKKRPAQEKGKTIQEEKKGWLAH